MKNLLFVMAGVTGLMASACSSGAKKEAAGNVAADSVAYAERLPEFEEINTYFNSVDD